ncbi:MAG: hypothetical protein ACRCWW_09230 [Scandinavium sp.]|uniref:hypothetical protein n=1 Tax=Scandinavium sp. TaxID=2830653 RepID=UPI003F30FBFC
MTQKTLVEHLSNQTRNAISWLKQKVPGTENYTPGDLARDVLIAVIKPTPETNGYKPYNDTLNGYQFDGPEGPGTYIDGIRIHHDERES